MVNQAMGRALFGGESPLGRQIAQLGGDPFSTLAVLGLGLASLGLYGVVSRAVAQRRSEFGVRLALGARPGDIIRLVLASGVRLGIIGCAVGLLGAVGVSRAFRAVLPGMQTSVLPVLAGAALVLIAVALVASLMPARSASRTRITDALRAEQARPPQARSHPAEGDRSPAVAAPIGLSGRRARIPIP